MPTDEDACNICEGDRSTPKNPIIFCDGKGCNMPVHKRCYDVQTIPKGEWFCERCEYKNKKKIPTIVCCPIETGAIKKTTLIGDYIHVVCAMWNMVIDINTCKIPQTILDTQTCYFCSQKQGLCIQCDEESCSTLFHVTCAINNGIITPAATVPSNFSPRCVKHQIKTEHTNKMGRRLRPSRVISDTEESEEDEEEEEESDEEEEEEDEEEEEEEEEEYKHKSPKSLFPNDQTSDESDDNMGTKSKKKEIPMKRENEESDDEMGTKKLSYKDRLDAKRKKTNLIITPPPSVPQKQKLPNKAHLNNLVKKPNNIKDINEIQNDIRSSNQRWTSLQHSQPTTPHSITTMFFDGEVTKSQQNDMNKLKEALRDETRKFQEFKRNVMEIFKSLNVGVDPSMDIETYISQLQSTIKRVGPIREEERVQIQTCVKDILNKK